MLHQLVVKFGRKFARGLHFKCWMTSVPTKFYYYFTKLIKKRFLCWNFRNVPLWCMLMQCASTHFCSKLTSIHFESKYISDLEINSGAKALIHKKYVIKYATTGELCALTQPGKHQIFHTFQKPKIYRNVINFWAFLPMKNTPQNFNRRWSNSFDDIEYVQVDTFGSITSFWLVFSGRRGK